MADSKTGTIVNEYRAAYLISKQHDNQVEQDRIIREFSVEIQKEKDRVTLKLGLALGWQVVFCEPAVARVILEVEGYYKPLTEEGKDGEWVYERIQRK